MPKPAFFLTRPDLNSFVMVLLASIFGILILNSLGGRVGGYTAYVPHAIASALLARRFVRRVDRTISTAEAFKIAVLTTIPTLLIVAPFLYLIHSITSPTDPLNWGFVEFAGALLLAALILSIFVSWVFALLGSWFTAFITFENFTK